MVKKILKGIMTGVLGLSLCCNVNIAQVNATNKPVVKKVVPKKVVPKVQTKTVKLTINGKIKENVTVSLIKGKWTIPSNIITKYKNYYLTLDINKLTIVAKWKIDASNLYALSDSSIQQAITLGKTAQTFGYTLSPITDNTSMFSGETGDSYVKLYTPFSSIVLYASSAFSKYENYTVTDAKKDIVNDMNKIIFLVNMNGYNIDFHKHTVVVLKQNGKFIQPLVNTWKDELAETDDFEHYGIYFEVKFPLEQVNVNEPFQLWVVPFPTGADAEKAVYNINLKNYK